MTFHQQLLLHFKRNARDHPNLDEFHFFSARCTLWVNCRAFARAVGQSMCINDTGVTAGGTTFCVDGTAGDAIEVLGEVDGIPGTAGAPSGLASCGRRRVSYEMADELSKDEQHRLACLII